MMEYELEPLAQWQEGQGDDLPVCHTLKAGELYAIDGGVFKARRNEESGRLELWTWQGKEGHVIARTGFEVGEHGGLYDRIYDLELEQQMVTALPRFTVADVTPVTPEKAAGLENAAPLDALADRFEHIRQAERVISRADSPDEDIWIC